MQAVIVLIGRQVKPRCEAGFERVMDQSIATAATSRDIGALTWFDLATNRV
jgi:hypothetical protein